MPNPDSAPMLVKLAAWFVNVFAGKLAGDLSKDLVMFAGKDMFEKLESFFKQGEHAKKILTTFQMADECY
jgi:hypothetical protein